MRGGRSNSVGKPARASHSNSVDSSFVSASGPAAVGYEEAVLAVVERCTPRTAISVKGGSVRANSYVICHRLRAILCPTRIS